MICTYNSVDEVHSQSRSNFTAKLDPQTLAGLSSARTRAGLTHVLAVELKSDLQFDLFGKELPLPRPRILNRSLTPDERRQRVEDRRAEKYFRESGMLGYTWEPIPTHPEEEEWRHGHWSEERMRILAAMHMSNRSASRIERFECCGSQAIVKRNVVTGALKVEANQCHDRFCEPCARARAFNVQENLKRQLTGTKFRKITFTLVSSNEPLADRIEHLLASLRRLREQKIWREGVLGGAYAVEVTINKETGLWHPHLHIVCEGEYLPCQLLKACWLKATGDSDYVHIKDGGSAARAAEYAAKYAGKGIDLRSVKSIEHLCEAIVGMTGRRSLSTFGTWRGLVLENNPEPRDADQWETVGRLVTLWQDARNGDTDAIAILDQLHGVQKEESCPIVPPS